ncbi:50S ribosomal protein L21 [Myxococcota bacterium]|nr:50S ribosomal protein L21 [Myxococcota bacterium]
MYAVVEIGSKQYRVAVNDTVQVDRLALDVGADATFAKVVLVGGDEIKVGAPTVEGASVTARVVSHDQGDKVITFKYRRRRRSRVRRGFRASLTTLEITGINA